MGDTDLLLITSRSLVTRPPLHRQDGEVRSSSAHRRSYVDKTRS